MKFVLLSLLGCLITTTLVESFANTAPTVVRRNSVLASSTADEIETEADIVSNSNTKPLKRDRYIASNRFSVRSGKEVKFEKRWANRKSRLAELDGFKYFHLMRRVSLDDENGVRYDGGEDKDASQGNYVSLTVWDNKGDFNAWRKGDAFKEAHGGTSVGAFVKTMVSSALILRGAPKPAFYDGLLVQSEAPESMPETVDGWRNIEFPQDGSNLPAECFVACNQFFVPKENAVAFEQRWKNRESKLSSCEGFVTFSMMRRDAKMKTHGSKELEESVEPTYLSTTIWKDRASFDKWRNGSNFSKSHGQKGEGEENKTKDDAPKKPPQAQGPPMWSRPPKPIFYEGTLVISTADGA
jgi:heme-degrading monooxygenase HmoA